MGREKGGWGVGGGWGGWRGLGGFGRGWGGLGGLGWSVTLRSPPLYVCSVRSRFMLWGGWGGRVVGGSHVALASA